MENINQEFESEESAEELGEKFNSMDSADFVSLLREKIKKDPTARFSITANWVDKNKARAAKALLDLNASRLHIDSITIKATRQQYEEDENAFESGVKWQEID